MARSVSCKEGIFALLAVALLLSPGREAAAQAACNCSVKLGSCFARISFRHEVAHISVNTSQCAQVAYSVNGNPTAATITDGSGDQDWLGVPDGVPVSFESCSICASGTEAARDAGGIKLNVSPTGRRDPTKANEIRKDALKLLGRPGS
ncbi:hypothetical protein PMI42_03466 [Bradyrhizobium sp. YR681]|uniref:hypothetical protein n=1 Tax=Bradyrhizobium sp. YR681 TaxID=1144344 RepID=UPI000270E745|nr:hypothetical protein [Bradyrhizobium sp. YR681]EJN13174.1 hypothetical protein PMI42_03466 [Bradyrhizobium sp. YR681]